MEKREWIVGAVRLVDAWKTRRGDMQYEFEDAMEGKLPLQTELILYYREDLPELPRYDVLYEVVIRPIGEEAG